jgi:hypothetical protein
MDGGRETWGRDGWMVGCTDGCTDGKVDGCYRWNGMNGWIDGSYKREFGLLCFARGPEEGGR